MKLSPQDRARFSKTMNRLADHFNNSIRDGLDNNADLTKNIATHIRMANKAHKDFRAKGYTSAQWNKLLETSGAAKKMGAYGGAMKFLTPKQFAKTQGIPVKDVKIPK